MTLSIAHARVTRRQIVGENTRLREALKSWDAAGSAFISELSEAVGQLESARIVLRLSGDTDRYTQYNDAMTRLQGLLNAWSTAKKQV